MDELNSRLTKVTFACFAIMAAAVVCDKVVPLKERTFMAVILFILILGIQYVIYGNFYILAMNFWSWIKKKGLVKILYFRKKIEQRQVAQIVVEPEIEEIKVEIDIPKSDEYLEELRNERLEKAKKEKEKKLNVAIDYTQKSFALYLSDEDLKVLCQNVRVYVGKLDVKELKPVKVKTLQSIDLRHFGWNIWIYFKPRNQMDIANLLKIVFPDIFEKAEVSTIKSHLRINPEEGIIKIEENILDQKQ